MMKCKTGAAVLQVQAPSTPARCIRSAHLAVLLGCQVGAASGHLVPHCLREQGRI